MKNTITPTTTLLVVVTFLLLFGMAARTPIDSDLFWHLRAGEETLRTGKPLLVDAFSHTREGQPWVNHSWLSQVGLVLLFRAGGYLALGAAVAGLAALSMWLVYLQCDGPAALKVFALILGGVVASVVWVARPQLASLALTALTGFLLYRYKWRGGARLWLLPFIFALWSNLHGGYVLGLLLIAAMLGGEILNHLLGRRGPEVLPWNRIARLLAWMLVSIAAVLVNPNGFDTWRIPFQTVNVGVLQQFISEWASPDFHDPLQQSLLWLLLGTFAGVGLSKRQLDGTDLLTFCGLAYLALLARRNYGPFALMAVPILVRHAASIAVDWRSAGLPFLARWTARHTPGREDGDHSPAVAARQPLWQHVLNLAIAAVIALAVMVKLVVVTHPVLVSGYLQQQFPVRAAAWLAENQPPGRLLNEYNWGGYLQWTLRGYPVFVDGRTDLFGDRVIGDWMTLVSAGPGWQVLLDEYAPDLVLLEPSRSLIAALDDLGWQRLFSDSQAVIYARPAD